MLEPLPLQGMGIVVTRAAHQAQHLVQLIAAAGGESVLFPVLEILDAVDMPALNALIARLDHFDMAIFISPNAVGKAMELIRAQRELPAHLTIAAIGRGSQKELERHGIQKIVVPVRQFDSEGLLELPQFQDMSGKRVVIFRGEGGREVLGDTLLARGAQLEYAECYRRGKPDADAAPLLQRWARGGVQATTVTSSEGLHNLLTLLGESGLPWLRKTPLFAPHARIATAARNLGLERVIVTAAGDEGLLRGLVEWQTQRKP